MLLLLLLLLLYSDPDSVLLCILAMDEEDEDDVALQIHFTLIQAFCYENHINILRVSGLVRLEQLLAKQQQPGGGTFTSSKQPRDLHCLLVTVRPVITARNGLILVLSRHDWFQISRIP